MSRGFVNRGLRTIFAWVTGRGQAIIPVPQTGFPYYGRVSPTIVSIALLGQMPRLPRYKNWSSMCCFREVISIVALAQETLPKSERASCHNRHGNQSRIRGGSLIYGWQGRNNGGLCLPGCILFKCLGHQAFENTFRAGVMKEGLPTLF